MSGQSSSRELSSLLANLRLERALLDALEALSSVDVVSFKGTLLTRWLYGDLSGRTSTDNDLLVRPHDFERAVELLLARGYSLFGPLKATPEAVLGFDQVELYPPPGREQVIVDLHRYAFSRRHFAADESLVWQNLETVELHGRNVQTFRPELALVHLVAHAICHGLSERSLTDLQAALASLNPASDLGLLRMMARKTVGLSAFEATCRLAAGGLTSASTTPRGAELGAKATLFSLPWRERTSVVLRVRLLEQLLPGLRAPGFRTPLVAFVLLAPARIVAVCTQALYPGRAELMQRFGARPAWSLALSHVQEIARKWNTPASSHRDE